MGEVVINYILTNGVAVPRDLYTLGIFQGLQRAINSLAGRFAVDEDGQIGPATLREAQALIAEGNAGTSNDAVIPPPTSVASLADRANTYATELAAWQDRRPDFTPKPTQRQRETMPQGAPSPASGAWSGKRVAVVGALILAGAWLGLRKG